MKNDKLKLFELAVKKVSQDPKFIAYYIHDHKALGCSRMNYLKLALCLVPKDLNGLKRICEYAELISCLKLIHEKLYTHDTIEYERTCKNI
jgi:hypothetical protein